MVGTFGLIERLLALLILRKNIRPKRRDEDARVVAEAPGGGVGVFGNRQAAQPEIAKRVRNAAIEKNRTPGLFLRNLIRAGEVEVSVARYLRTPPRSANL